MCAPSPPPPPDPKEVAGAQTANNIGTSIANSWLTNPDQNTPYGSTTMTQKVDADGNPMFYEYTDPNTGDVHQIPMNVQNTVFSPEEQKRFETGQQTKQVLANTALSQSNRLYDHLGTGLDMSGLTPGADPSAIRRANLVDDVRGQRLDTNYEKALKNAGNVRETYGTDFSEDRLRVEDALFSRLNPSLEREKESLRTSLVNQGIREGSTAFDRAMNRFGEKSNDARMQAILAGGQEQSRLADLEARRAGFENAAQMQKFGQNMGVMDASNAARSGQFGLDLGRANFVNNSRLQQQQADTGFEGFKQQTRNAQMGELFAQRNQPINEISALMSGSQVSMPTMPSFNASPMAGVDRAGLEMDAYNAEMNAYNASMANRNSMMGGLFGLAGNIIASDERVKEDIEKVGETDDGQNIYSYRYKGSPRTEIGLMAQEVQKRKPEAVHRGMGGILGVDYAEALR